MVERMMWILLSQAGRERRTGKRGSRVRGDRPVGARRGWRRRDSCNRL